MRKALTFPLPAVEPSAFLWMWLTGELSATLLLLGDGSLPAVAIRVLQVFLRF
jgi:hypothetical protein